MFEVSISDRADADIQNAFEWWGDNYDRDQAKRWYFEILKAISSLSKMPRRCVVVRGTARFGREVHQLLFGMSSKPTHRILFGIDGNQVVVFRVRGIRQRDLKTVTELL